MRTDELVSSVDVFTTILDYADADQPRYLTGKSLLNLIKGGKNPVREKIITYLKSPRVHGDPWANGKTGYSYRSKDWHSFWIPELSFSFLKTSISSFCQKQNNVWITEFEIHLVEHVLMTHFSFRYIFMSAWKIFARKSILGKSHFFRLS